MPRTGTWVRYEADSLPVAVPQRYPVPPIPLPLLVPKVPSADSILGHSSQRAGSLDRFAQLLHCASTAHGHAGPPVHLAQRALAPAAAAGKTRFNGWAHARTLTTTTTNPPTLRSTRRGSLSPPHHLTTIT